MKKGGGAKRTSIWKAHVYERFQGQQTGERRQSIGSGAPAPDQNGRQAVLGERHAASLGVAAGGREMRVEAVCKAVKEATGGDGRGEERRESRACGWVGGWVGVSFFGGGHSFNTLKGDQKENHHWGSPCFGICLFFGWLQGKPQGKPPYVDTCQSLQNGALLHTKRKATFFGGELTGATNHP